MATALNVPIWSTQDLWEKYVTTGQRLTEAFRDRPEDFLITRLEDARHLAKLPTQPHRREVHELVFVTRGKIIRSANLHRIEINAGEVYLLLANQISTVNFLSEDLTGFYCHFSLETIIRLYHREHMINELATLGGYMRSQAIKLKSKVRQSVNAIFERIMDEYTTNNDLSLIDAYLVTLCYEIKNSLQADEPKARASKSFDLTERFKLLIVNHVHQHQAISFYADHLGVSPNHLNKVVKQTTGKNASAMIADMLVLEAKTLLRHSALSVAEIAYRLGFTDHSYFSRFFRTNTGSTPTAYRKLR